MKKYIKKPLKGCLNEQYIQKNVCVQKNENQKTISEFHIRKNQKEIFYKLFRYKDIYENKTGREITRI